MKHWTDEICTTIPLSGKNLTLKLILTAGLVGAGLGTAHAPLGKLFSKVGGAFTAKTDSQVVKVDISSPALAAENSTTGAGWAQLWDDAGVSAMLRRLEEIGRRKSERYLLASGAWGGTAGDQIQSIAGYMGGDSAFAGSNASGGGSEHASSEFQRGSGNAASGDGGRFGIKGSGSPGSDSDLILDGGGAAPSDSQEEGRKVNRLDQIGSPDHPTPPPTVDDVQNVPDSGTPLALLVIGLGGVLAFVHTTAKPPSK